MVAFAIKKNSRNIVILRYNEVVRNGELSIR